MSPKTAMWINIVIAVLGFLTSAASLETPVFGQAITAEIVSVSGFVLGLIGSVNTVLHAVSAPVAGPMLKYIRGA